jgi:hypothetical protein
MAFNAGGTNVGGVLQTEQGVLKTALTATAISGTGFQNIDFTVPAGKKWIIKGISSNVSSGTYTVSSQELKVVIDGKDCGLYNVSASTMAWMVTGQLVIPAGGIVRHFYNVSAFTGAGNYNSKICYLEADA